MNFLPYCISRIRQRSRFLHCAHHSPIVPYGQYGQRRCQFQWCSYIGHSFLLRFPTYRSMPPPCRKMDSSKPFPFFRSPFGSTKRYEGIRWRAPPRPDNCTYREDDPHTSYSRATWTSPCRPASLSLHPEKRNPYLREEDQCLQSVNRPHLTYVKHHQGRLSLRYRQPMS